MIENMNAFLSTYSWNRVLQNWLDDWILASPGCPLWFSIAWHGNA